MFELKGIGGESIVVDAAWVEKMRSGSSVGRQPVSSYRDTTVNPFTRKKFVVFGEEEERLHVVVACQTFFGLTVPAAKSAEVGQLVRELQTARDRLKAE